MTWTQAIIVYSVCWWLLLFIVLPIGVRPAENPEPGADPAAPVNPRLGLKCAVITGIAVIVTWVISIIVNSGIISVK